MTHNAVATIPRSGPLAHRVPSGTMSTPVRVWRWLGQDKAHNEANLVLAPGELAVLSTRRHWLVPCKDLMPMTVTMPLAFVVSIGLDMIATSLWWLQLILWMGTAGHCAMVGYRIMVWRADMLTVTNEGRLLRVYGVFERHVVEYRLGKVSHRELHQSVASRLLNYGTLRLESGGQHDEGASGEFLKWVPQAERIFRLVHEHTLETQWQRMFTRTAGVAR